MAYLSAIIVNLAKKLYSKEDEHVELSPVEDFFPKWGEDAQTAAQQTPEEMKAVLTSIANLFKQKE
jgi:hypothetical protein